MKSTAILKLATLVSLGLAVAAPAMAANTYKFASIEGGSSAFLGNFSAGASFAQGALPQVIRQVTSDITGYKVGGDVDEAILATNVTLTDGTNTETAGTAEILFNAFNNGGTVEGTSDYRIIVLLRTDSGFGVRYIANKFYIKSWGAFTTTDGTAITPSGSGTVPEQVANYLTGHTGRTKSSISAGLSDVSADTIYRYANFPNLSTSGLKNLVGQRAGILTLLPLYDGGTGATQDDFTRTNFKGLIGGTVHPAGLNTVYYREQTSGTRNTEVLDVQVTKPFAASGGTPNHLNYTAEAGGTQVTSTGTMLTDINTNAGSFGYAFVTGTAGSGKTNVLVGAYNKINPLTGTATSSTPVGLPTYGTGVPFPGVTNGTYTAWSYEEVYESGATDDATADSIVSALNDPSNSGLVHQQGLIQVSELNTDGFGRDSFTSDVVGTNFTAETVYDGQAVGTTSTRTNSASFFGTPQP